MSSLITNAVYEMATMCKNSDSNSNRERSMIIPPACQLAPDWEREDQLTLVDGDSEPREESSVAQRTPLHISTQT